MDSLNKHFFVFDIFEIEYEFDYGIYGIINFLK
jgi:hypothetical protein